MLWRILPFTVASEQKRRWGSASPDVFIKCGARFTRHLTVRSAHPTMNMDDLVYLSALNQYDYCPRRCYYIFVENVFTENEHTVEGSLQHSRANSGETSTREGTLQLRSVYLFSQTLGICGKADVIE